MPAAHHREREAKFRVAPDQNPALFSQPVVIDGYSFQSPSTQLQDDTYLDTPAYDLLRRGLALRLRRNGSASEVGIKSIKAARKGAIQDRLDIAFTLPARAKPLDAATWPATIEEELDPYSVKLNDLRPLLVVRQQRRKAHLHPNGSTTPLAEWSLDEVWIDSIESGQQELALAHFHELEIELLAPEGGIAAVQNASDAFTTLVEQVRDNFKLSPTYTSKLMRGLAETLAQSHDNADTLTPTMALEAAGRLLLHQQLLQILLNEHGVRAGKRARYVHDMRVAIRRALAAMQLSQNAYAEETLVLYEKGLKRLGRRLGTVRDLDVALENLRAFRRRQPEELHKGFKLLRAELRSRRADAHAELLALLDSKKHCKFIAKFAHFCATPSQAKVENSPFEVSPSQVRHTVPSLIQGAFEAVRAYETVFDGGDRPPLETFHALRIQSKYLRYLLEFTQHLLGDGGESLMEQVRDLQEHLGELNDNYVEQARLHQWAEAAQEDSTLGEAIDARLSQISAHINELATDAPSHLATFIAHPTRAKLATALANI